MRITNSMISNASSLHIANAKDYLMTRQNQYSTGKKIMRPSDDPIVAIRSLQLRTTYSKLQQYIDKNVKDALSWMESTERIMNQIVGPTGITTSMKEKLDEGAKDSLAQSQRHAVLEEVQEYVKAIFEENANSDFAGRYLMTGYRTDTSLLFPEDTGVNAAGEGNLQYEIREHLSASNIRSVSYVSSGLKYIATNTAQDYVTTGADTMAQTPVYRMQLAYDNCSNAALAIANTLQPPEADKFILKNAPISINLADADGNPVSGNGITNGNITSVTTMKSTVLNETGKVNGDSLEMFMADSDAQAIYLYDTGEVILNGTAYNLIQQNNAQINVTYTKTEFEEGDIRPEMYFECSSYNGISDKATYYRDPSNQNIQYEINFTQTAVVNVQAKDALSTDIYRTIDYLAQTIYAVDDVERRIAEVDNLIENTTEDDPKMEDYTQLKELLETEQKLRTKTMNDAFGMSLTMVDKAEDTLNAAMANLGTRYKRVELTRDKLEDDLLNTEEKLSDNEDVDIADAYINLTQADTLYQAALSATAKILGNSLLNYI